MKLILFDLDNTLIDRKKAFNLWLKNLAGEKNSCITEKVSEISKLDNEDFYDHRILAEKLSEILPCLNLSPGQILNSLRDILLFIRPDETTNSVLRKLKEKYKLAIVTNGSGIVQREKIKRAGLQSFFGSVFISGETGIKKPDKRIFLLPLEKYGVKPEDTVMTGDDEIKDIAGAKSLGIRTILISDRKDVKTEADEVIVSIEELKEKL